MQTAIPQETLDAYQSAIYRVYKDQEQFDMLIDQPCTALRALYDRTGQSAAVFITAFNPCGEQSPEAQNLAAQEALRRELKTLTQYTYAGVGEDPMGTWTGEPSWLALGIDLEDSRRLGEKFEQNAVVWSGPDAFPRLILLR